MSNSIRLNKFLSQSGVASRRAADDLILSGAIQVNGVVTKNLGIRVDPIKDSVRVRGRIIKPEEKIYIIFNKPRSVITSSSDPYGRKTVMEYLEDLSQRVFPVGRLDWDSEGLLLLTNDGDFAHKVLHPSHEIPKIYHVKIEGELTPEKEKKLLTGVTIPGGKVNFKSIEQLKSSDTKHSWFRVVVTQGLNRQVRNMFSKVGLDVLKLHRVGIGSLELGTLEKGHYKLLNPSQLEKIFENPLKPKKKIRQKSKKRIPIID